MEVKDFKVIIEKTKIMECGVGYGEVEKSGHALCARRQLVKSLFRMCPVAASKM